MGGEADGGGEEGGEEGVAGGSLPRARQARGVAIRPRGERMMYCSRSR